MVNRVVVGIISIGLLSVLAWGAEPAVTDPLIAPTVAEAVAGMAAELLVEKPDQVDAAMVFLQAAVLLNERSGAGDELYLRGAGQTCRSNLDYRDATLHMLRRYVDYKADLELAAGALACVIDQTNSRQEREDILTRLQLPFAAANPMFGSDIAAQLGLYAVEKADYPSAVQQFEYAVQLNPYNLTAQAKLFELRTAQTQNAAFIESLNWLRLKLAVNPTDLQAAVELGQTAYRAELYDLAADAFEYAAMMFQAIRPGAAMHYEIAVGCAESCYFIPSRIEQVLTIARQLRQSGVVNLQLEAAAALAAQKSQKTQMQNEIIAEAIVNAEKQIETGQPTMSAYDLGWFYCFVADSPENALAWCNKAYKQSPEAVGCKALMAYAFLLNGQEEMAEQYATPLAEKDPVAMLTLAQLYAAKDQSQKAVELLNQAKSYYTPLPIRLKVEALLKQIGLEGVSQVSAELINESLVQRWGEKVIPAFLAPQKLVSVKLKFDGEEFFYGNPLSASLVIENTSKQPLIIGPQRLITGRYRVDAAVRGDITRAFPMLVERTFRPSRALMPGETITTRVNLNTGQLAKTLFSHPQAELTIDFKLYLDPVSDVDGTPKNAIQGLGIVQSVVRRKKVELTREFLVQRLDALVKGQEGQKIRAAELFCGLYAERIAADANQVAYKYTAVDVPLLVDSIRRAILDDNWKVQTHILVLLAQYPVRLDYSMTQSVSEVLNHEKWPNRMVALWLLGQSQKEAFSQVLDWKAQNDPFWLNQHLAKAMGGNSLPQKTLENAPSAQKTE